MVIARSTRENIPYVIEAERDLPAEQQTVFRLAVLPNYMMLAILQLVSKGENQQWIEVALYAGLRGWENFPDEEGNQTSFQREESRTRTIHGVEVRNPVRKETLERLPSTLLVELANAVVSANQIKDDDAKN